MTRAALLNQIWKNKNREKVRECNKKWAKNNPEKVRESNRRYVKNNRIHVNDYKRKWRKANPDKVRQETLKRRKPTYEEARENNLKRYGLTIKSFNKKRKEQKNRCAICGRKPQGAWNDTVLHVDHDHSLHVTRGLLCGKCNKALGLFKDNQVILKAAIQYLRRYQKCACS